MSSRLQNSNERLKTYQRYLKKEQIYCPPKRLEPKVFDYIEGDKTTFEREPLERLSSEGELQAFKYDGFWQCMDTMRDKMFLEELLEKNEAPWKVWDK